MSEICFAVMLEALADERWADGRPWGWRALFCLACGHQLHHSDRRALLGRFPCGSDVRCSRQGRGRVSAMALTRPSAASVGSTHALRNPETDSARGEEVLLQTCSGPRFVFGCATREERAGRRQPGWCGLYLPRTLQDPSPDEEVTPSSQHKICRNRTETLAISQPPLSC